MVYLLKIVIFYSYVSLPEGNHLEKYEFVNGKDDIPYMIWKKNMFETTNQHSLSILSTIWRRIDGTRQQLSGAQVIANWLGAPTYANGSVSKPCTPGEHKNSW